MSSIVPVLSIPMLILAAFAATVDVGGVAPIVMALGSLLLLNVFVVILGARVSRPRPRSYTRVWRSPPYPQR